MMPVIITLILKLLSKLCFDSMYISYFVNWQQTLIIWGEQDRVFPLELGLRLQRFV
jgi:hypothetical protein